MEALTSTEIKAAVTMAAESSSSDADEKDQAINDESMFKPGNAHGSSCNVRLRKIYSSSNFENCAMCKDRTEVTLRILFMYQDVFREFVESFAILWSLFLAECKKMTWVETKEILKRRIPPLVWIPQYTFEKFRLDLTVNHPIR